MNGCMTTSYFRRTVAEIAVKFPTFAEARASLPETKSFQEDIGKVFKPERQAQGIKFTFAVTAVHRGYIYGNMPFVIDLFLGLEFFRAKDNFL